MAAEDAYPYLPSEDLATGLTPDSGRLLVASPLLEDPHFARSVVLLLDVDPGGALGVVLNRPGPTEVAAVLERWHESVGEPPVVFEGGPVSPEIALGVATLAAADGSVPTPVGWHPVFDRCGLVDLDAPVEVVRPALAGLRIYAGYAGWSAGQLDDEIAQGGWIVLPGAVEDAVSPAPQALWSEVLRRQSGPLAWLASYPSDPSAN